MSGLQQTVPYSLYFFYLSRLFPALGDRSTLDIYLGSVSAISFHNFLVISNDVVILVEIGLDCEISD